MTNLLIERDATQKLNPDGDSFGQYPFPVKSGQKIFAGAAVALVAGYLANITAVAGLQPVGRAMESFDNTSGADGAGTVKVEQGVLAWDISSGDPVTQADVGNDVFFEDNHTIAKTTGAGLTLAGKLLALVTNASTGATSALVETNWRQRQTESAVGITTLSIAGAAGTQTTTSGVLAGGIVELTGAITGNRVLNITDAATGKQWTFANKTTGAFTVQIEIAGANPITIASGTRAILYSDGTQIRRVTPDT